MWNKQCEANQLDGGEEPGGAEPGGAGTWSKRCYKVRINQCDNSTLELIN